VASGSNNHSKVKAIRIHIEGGGDQRDKKQELRKGLGQFLSSLRELARRRNIQWDIVVCGSRNNTFDYFKTALKVHPAAFNILLIDSEGPVKSQPWEHLRRRDRWSKPARVTEDQCHLMVQAMEAWLIADLDTLQTFYGQGFNPKPIPKTANVESVGKRILQSSLREASRDTRTGKYHKTRHAPKILACLKEETVRKKARHCDRLFVTLTKLMDSAAV
jgi:hypothetical protein